MNLDSPEKRKPITFNDAIPLVSLYWRSRIAKSDGVDIPESIAKIMDSTPEYIAYSTFRNEARANRDAKLRNNPQNSHA